MAFEQPDRMNAYVELKKTKEYKRALSARKEVEKMIIAQVHNEKWANMKYKDLNLRGPYSKARQVSLGKKVASSILNLELGTSPFTVAFDDVDYDKIKF